MTTAERPLRREERAQLARILLRALPRADVARKLGVGESGLRSLLNDPDGSKQKARRERYRGRCRNCGAKTDGSCGLSCAPTLCAKCLTAEQHEQRYWTRERCVEAIREWARRRGRPPFSREWLLATRAELTDDDGYIYPHPAMVLRECGTWLNAIREAGLEPPDYPRRRKSLAYYLEKLRDVCVDGQAPRSKEHLAIMRGLARYGLTWLQACEQIGVRPHGRVPVGPRYTVDDYVERLRRLSPDGVTAPPSRQTSETQTIRAGLQRRGVTWRQAVAQAGLEPYQRRYKRRETG